MFISSRPGSCRRRTGVTEPPTIKIQDGTDLSGEDGYVSDSSTSATDTDDIEMTDDSTPPLNIVNRTGERCQ